MRSYYEHESQSYSYGFGRHLTSTIKWLLIISAGVFFLQLLMGTGFVKVFGMIPGFFFGKGALWQPLTGLFLHGGLWHLLMTGLVLWFFAPDVEFAIGGGKKFLRFYLVCGTLSNITAFFLAPSSLAPILGPGGAIFGILTAFAVLFPERVITLLLFFVIPVQLKAKYLVLIFGLIEWFSLMEGSFSQIWRYANLAGIGVGYLYIRRMQRTEASAGGGGVGKWGRRQKENREEYIRRKIDPILEKIAQKGLHSLTWRERRILRNSKRKLN